MGFICKGNAQSISMFFICRIMTMLRDVTAWNEVSSIEQTLILVIMYVETVKTDIVVFIGNVTMWLTSDRWFSISEAVRWNWQFHSEIKEKNVKISNKYFYYISDFVSIKCLTFTTLSFVVSYEIVISAFAFY